MFIFSCYDSSATLESMYRKRSLEMMSNLAVTRNQEGQEVSPSTSRVDDLQKPMVSAMGRFMGKLVGFRHSQSKKLSRKGDITKGGGVSSHPHS
jgi:predicted site-specific integrase-resolvase